MDQIVTSARNRTKVEPDPLRILVNDSAGRRGVRARQALTERLERTGTLADVVPIEPQQLESSIRDLIARRAHLVGIGGGDGTISSAADALAGTGTTLLPIPLGTLNHFCRRLGIEDVDAAVRAAGAGRTETVPAGFIDDSVFLNTVTIGSYADVVRRRDRLKPYITKWPAAFIAIVTTLIRLRWMEVIVNVDGDYLRRRTSLLWVGVGSGSFPHIVETPPEPTTPSLEIVILRPQTRLGAIALLFRMLRGLLAGERPTADPGLEILHSRSFLVLSPHRTGITIDGEVRRGRAPIFLSILESALRVRLPRKIR